MATALVAPEGDILDRRNTAQTYDEAVLYAMDLVEQHFHEENPDQIDACMRLYATDAVWEAPARGVIYRGQDDIRKNYLAVFEAAENIAFFGIERFGTPDRVVDDMWVTFRVRGPGFENCPYPVGTDVKMRLVHIFHIEDGLISKEIGYECWTIDPRPGVSPLTY
ncbi:nuclear transport factor 2 family protein [uncultured Sphingomonas sp.]|uniref:nuclear transport factor 2 family protein n=1 Tax=uncultured Sphingomonas sp. TaxID=158754 RepID=UPI0035C97952